jgi:hypothetical protein
MNKTYRLGPDTNYSVQVITEQLGYNFNDLRNMTEGERFDFAICVIPEVKEWFANFREIVETPLVARAFLHALNLEVVAND